MVATRNNFARELVTDDERRLERRGTRDDCTVEITGGNRQWPNDCIGWVDEPRVRNVLPPQVCGAEIVKCLHAHSSLNLRGAKVPGTFAPPVQETNGRVQPRQTEILRNRCSRFRCRRSPVTD